MARRSSRLQAEDAPISEPPVAMTVAPPMEMMDEPPHAPAPDAGIEVKTKFPVARIKRIMQADEDVGKVAQVTPIAVCMYPSNYHSLTHSLPSFILTNLPDIQPKHLNYL